MKTIIIPGTNLKTSSLGFGTSRLHHHFSSRERQSLLNFAFELGFTHFDTARMYGHGIAERELGYFIKNIRNKVTIATKFGIPSNFFYENFPFFFYFQKSFYKLIKKKSCDYWKNNSNRFSLVNAKKNLLKSLTTLNTNWIDIYFLHEPMINDRDVISNIVDWLYFQKKKGIIRYVGLAGNAKNCINLNTYYSNFFDILQIEDSIENNESKILKSINKSKQITFGYLRNAKNINQDLINNIVKLNSKNLVLVSSNKKENLKQLSDYFS